MMKKLISILIVALMAILVFGFAGLALAQESTPSQPAPGQMRGGRWSGQTRMQTGMQTGMQSGMQSGLGQAGEPGPWHPAVIASLAEAFGMSQDTLQARLDAGETLWQVAESLGWTSEQLQSEMLAARSAALRQAVADGSLTQTQADFMAQRMNQGWPEGFGPGSANCDGSGQAHPGQGRQGGRGQGMRWNVLPTP